MGLRPIGACRETVFLHRNLRALPKFEFFRKAGDRIRTGDVQLGKRNSQ